MKKAEDVVSALSELGLLDKEKSKQEQVRVLDKEKSKQEHVGEF